MDKEFLFTAINDADEKSCKDCLSLLLSARAAPVFGAAQPIEHEMAAFRALQSIGVLSPKPEKYELVTASCVRKPKVRALLYQVGLCGTRVVMLCPERLPCLSMLGAFHQSPCYAGLTGISTKPGLINMPCTRTPPPN